MSPIVSIDIVSVISSSPPCCDLEQCRSSENSGKPSHRGVSYVVWGDWGEQGGWGQRAPTVQSALDMLSGRAAPRSAVRSFRAVTMPLRSHTETTSVHGSVRAARPHRRFSAWALRRVLRRPPAPRLELYDQSALLGGSSRLKLEDVQPPTRRLHPRSEPTASWSSLFQAAIFVCGHAP
ncbi:hypothetical protein NDU88_002706 [Pleurodeles waltl]|uniref:Uncharacterized protein n=1 Tax=Pleurodeles waltl TaxID=8319 RepID=A0AAV7WQP8_PLEWA|nr:hypothetical protein NDU88_002706 [Pleurodeles waltl]